MTEETTDPLEGLDSLMADLTADSVITTSERKTYKKTRERRKRTKRLLDKMGKEDVKFDEVDTKLETVMKGVSATWLAKALRMDLAQVKRRLASVTPMTGAKTQAHYDLKTAMPHLVDPVQDVEEYISNMDPKDLPTKLQEAFWRGQRVRLTALEEAGQLWDTAKVIELFGIMFKTLRDQTNLWLDTLDESSTLTDRQREIFGELINAMNKDILNAVKEYTDQHATRSQLQWIEDYVREHD